MTPTVYSVCVLLLLVFANSSCLKNGTLRRDKRHLIFYQSGTYKLVIGIAIPVKLGVKQSMAVGLNFQYQYGQATNITQLEKPYPPIIAKSRERRESVADNSRTLFYLGVESALNSYGLNGKDCLLKSICDNAMYPSRHDANGLYGELLHIALTPLYGGKYPRLDPIYVDAQKAGEFGVDCASLFPECPRGIGIMDIMSVLDN